jgi:3-hydroxyacyl-CoA dehydrogenase/enoyl-CoA hydratase/3-hydroxybutyryl-CoA epimerase
MHYAHQRGVADIVGRLEQLATKYGQRFQPDLGWDGMQRAS